jgi:hypothetical protein
VERERTAQLAGYAVGGLLPLLIAAVLVPLRDDMVSSNVALVLVFPVVAAAVLGGWRAGSVAAAVGALTFDFCFTKPYLSLTIDMHDDIETALLLLGVGVCVGLVASRTRIARRAADASRDEINRLHHVAELAARGASSVDLLTHAQNELQGLMGLYGCRFESGLSAGNLPRIEHNGAVTGTGIHEYSRVDRELELPRLGCELPVWCRGQEIGQFVLDPTPGVGVSLERRIVAVAIADQVGAALVTQ